MTTTRLQKIEAFVQAVTKIPAKGFNPIVPSKSVKIEVGNDNWQVSFVLEQNVAISMNLIYPWIPNEYKCDTIEISDGILTVGIRRR